MREGLSCHSCAWWSAGIGADFGVEGRFEPSDPAAEPGHHLGDHMVGADAQPLAGDLQRQMPVAEVPGDAQQVGRDRRPLFRRPAPAAARDPEIAAAVEFETVALDQVMRPRQVEQIGFARIGDQADAAAVPVEIGEGHRVDRRLFRPMPPPMHRNRPPHQKFTMRR